MSTRISRRHLLQAGAGALAMQRAATATPPAGKLIVDVHAHLKHGDAEKTEYSAKDIVGVMDAVGIDRSIVFAMSTTTQRSITFAEKAVAEYPKRLIPFLYALPNYERPVLADIDDALTNRGFRGIKIHAGECRLTPYVIDPVLELAGRRDVPCLIDATGSPSVARRLAESFPHTTILFAHMGAYMSRDSGMIDAFIQVAADYDNAYLDLSAVALVFKMEEAVQKVGADKLIWGTDGPHKNPNLNTYAQFEMEKVQRLTIPQADKDKILGGNIVKMLGLT
ncbi:MAG: amidohydrolase family protein [Acidobacteria bacterium]|nr:amidohydrolase family protein [Acidobacteriota bacterium]